MGCGESRQAAATDKKVVTDLTKVDMKTLTRGARFELEQLPITRTDVEVYYKAIRAIHPEKPSVSKDELI